MTHISLSIREPKFGEQLSTISPSSSLNSFKELMLCRAPQRLPPCLLLVTSRCSSAWLFLKNWIKILHNSAPIGGKSQVQSFNFWMDQFKTKPQRKFGRHSCWLPNWQSKRRHRDICFKTTVLLPMTLLKLSHSSPAPSSFDAATAPRRANHDGPMISRVRVGSLCSRRIHSSWWSGDK